MNRRPLAASLLAATITAVAATPASAQTGASTSWTGPYVGGQIGVSYIDNDRPQVLFDTNRDGTFNDTVRTAAGANAFSPGFCTGRALGATPTSGCDYGNHKLEGGAHVGFDFDAGGFVVGVVGEYDRTSLEDSVSAFSTTPANYVLTRKLRDSFGLRARAGVPVGDSALVYGTAGVVHGRVRNSFTSSNTANAFAVTDSRSNGWGFRAGGGVEQRFGSLSVGLLYLYSSIKDDNDNRIDVTRGTAPVTNPFVLVNAGGTQFVRTDDKFRSHSAKVTASLRF